MFICQFYSPGERNPMHVTAEVVPFVHRGVGGGKMPMAIRAPLGFQNTLPVTHVLPEAGGAAIEALPTI